MHYLHTIKLLAMSALLLPASAYVPYAFPNLKEQLATTRTHVRITYSALCIMIYEWISDRPEQANITRPVADADFAPIVRHCPLKDWPIHYNKNWDSLKAKLETLIDNALEKVGIDMDDWENRFQPFRVIEKYSGYVDLDSDTKSDPRYHFDAEKLTEGNELIIQKRRNITKLAKAIRKETSSFDLEVVRKQLGYLLHTLQDFYSHTNWVELGRSGTVRNLARNHSWPIRLAGPADATCRDCDEPLTAEQKAEADKLGVAIGESLGLHDAPVDDMRMCSDNAITSPELLTSGYTDSEHKEAGTGKCSHGGIIDMAATKLKPRGGINKDANYFLYAPHHRLHNESAAIAHQATLEFLRDLRKEINDTQFGILLGLLRSSAALPSACVWIISGAMFAQLFYCARFCFDA